MAPVNVEHLSQVAHMAHLSARDLGAGAIWGIVAGIFVVVMGLGIAAACMKKG